MLKGRFSNDKIIITCVLLASFLTFTGCSAENEGSAEVADAPKQRIVEVQKAIQSEWNETIELTGMVTTAEQVQIFAALGGEVSEVLVQNGDQVEAGDVLVQLDQTDAQLGVQQAQAGLDAANLQLESARSMRQQSIKQAEQQLEQSNQALQMIENARAEMEQPEIENASENHDTESDNHNQSAQQVEPEQPTPPSVPEIGSNVPQDDDAETVPGSDSNSGFLERWLDGGFPPLTFPDIDSLGDFDIEQELARAQSAVQAAELAVEQANRTDSIDAAEANVKQAKIGLEMAQRQAEQAVITSPISGEVVNLIVQENGMATPQMPLMSIVQTDELMIRTDASEREVVHIQPDQSVRLSIPALDQELEGHVTYISPVPGQESRKYPVELAFSNQEIGKVRVGMLAQVEIDSSPISGVEVPINALLENVDEETSKTYIFVITEETEQVQVERKEVTVAQETSEKVLITEGLNAGDQVVVQGKSSLEEGDLVTIRKSSQAEADT